MRFRYDASTKTLVERYLRSWLPLSGRTTSARTRIINADLSVITAAADKVLFVEDLVPWILNLELQSGRDPDLLPRHCSYSSLLRERHGVFVRSLVVLLRAEADHPDLTGVWQQSFPDEEPYLTFRYRVVRVWQEPVEQFLAGGLGLLPLAPLSAMTEKQLPGVIQQMQERIRREATADEHGILWTATGILMGLRYRRPLIAELLQGVHGMRESTFYQGIIEEGMEKGIKQEARNILQRWGSKRFGPPDTDLASQIAALDDRERIERMIDRIMDVQSWQELLAIP